MDASTPCRPTEDRSRIAGALTSFFPGADVEWDEASEPINAIMTLHGTNALDALRNRIHSARIIDAFRSHAWDGVAGARLGFTIGKQAATVGRLSLPVAPHPLGDIAIVCNVEDGDPWVDGEALLWWLAPRTEDGKIVD